MKLIIAEKKSVGEAIAAAIGVKDKEKGYMEGLNAIVSWCIGHVVELAPPSAYNERFHVWRWDDLPILPEQWLYTVRGHVQEQYKVLAELMTRPDVDTIVCATDAGREGELIFRLLYEKTGCKKPVQRLWISSMSEDAIRQGFQRMRPGQDYDRLYAAALCRQKADWMIGINASRIFSLLYSITLVVGRVMTPTLAMIVEREEVISHFTPERFYTVDLRCGFIASSPRLNSKEEAEMIAALCQYKTATVQHIEKKKRTEKPPKLYDLTALQRDANRLFGYSAQQTLDYTQALYESRLVTYPRTDSRYLTGDMEETLPELVQAVSGAFLFTSGVNHPVHPAQVIDDEKVSDHHAIIPTLDMARADLTSLPAGQKDILQLIVVRLLAAVGENHEYEDTKMSNVAGLSTAEAQKSNDMFLKCRYMDEITDGKGIVFATGTPISNSMVEMYTIQRYLQYETLKRQNMTHFDCWASTFGETVTALELAPEGTGYRARTRFAKFFNLPELMNMFKEIADVKTADQLNLPTPEAHYETIAVKPSDIQKRLIQSLSERAAAVHAHIVDPSIDNMLKITSDGRKLGLDQRLIDPMMPDHPESKVNACVDNIMRIWQEGQADKKTQLVFCDLSTPKTNASSRAAASRQMEEANKVQNDENIEALESANTPDSVPEPMIENVDHFSVYDDIRSKLISRGVPPEEIAYIHDANTEAKKKDLFAKVRSGQVRILLGSTTKMGAGTNCQDRLIALHDLDAPWRPGDLEQRAGRIVRQGNKNKEVFIYRYVTEASFDAFLWQTLENKQRFISQIMTSKSPVRSCEDVDEAALSYAEIKALCAGDPRIKEKMDLDIEVSRLRLMKADHETRRFDLEDQVRKGFPKKIRQSQERIEGYQKDLEGLAAHPVPEKGFAGMTVDDTHYTEKDKAGQALIEFCKHHFTTDPVPLGEYRGFSMNLEYDPVYKRFEATLKGTMSYRVELGSDVYGNLTRIDNVLKDIAKSLETTKLQLTDLENQMATAKEEMVKPFPKEEELQAKSARLAELNAELNMDGQQQQPEEMENNDAPEEESAKQSPRSILARLSNPCTNMAYSNLQQKHDLEAR